MADRQVVAALRVSTSFTAPATAPVSIAQARAWVQVVSGFSGWVGGSPPVATFQALPTTFLVRIVPTIAPPVAITFHATLFCCDTLTPLSLRFPSLNLLGCAGKPARPPVVSGNVTADLQAAPPSGERVDVLVQRLDPELPTPAYAHPGDAGADIYTSVDVELGPGERALVPTGLAIALPAGYAAFVHPRSGLAHKFGVSIVNTPGTVDAGYRGEIKVSLINHDPEQPVVLRRGDRIAQLVIQRVELARFHEVEALPGSARGTGGHGSTGGVSIPDAAPAGKGN